MLGAYTVAMDTSYACTVLASPSNALITLDDAAAKELVLGGTRSFVNGVPADGCVLRGWRHVRVHRSLWPPRVVSRLARPRLPTDSTTFTTSSLPFDSTFQLVIGVKVTDTRGLTATLDVQPISMRPRSTGSKAVSDYTKKFEARPLPFSPLTATATRLTNRTRSRHLLENMNREEENNNANAVTALTGR